MLVLKWSDVLLDTFLISQHLEAECFFGVTDLGRIFYAKLLDIIISSVSQGIGHIHLLPFLEDC